MSTPAVAVGTHDRYTPELRDRILQKLSKSMAETAFGMLTPAHLRDLAAIDSPSSPVLSLYLQLSPDRRANGAWHTYFRSLYDATLKRFTATRERQAVKDELDRIEETLQAGIPVLGRGVAFFACRPRGLWRQIAVSVALPDGVYLDAKPHIRPLVRTLDEHDRFVLVLLSQERSRFFISQIGQVEEVFTVKGERLSRLRANQVGRDQGNIAVPEAVKHQAGVLAHAARMVLAQFEGRYLLVSGPAELRTALIHNLPKDVQRRVGGEFSIGIDAGLAEIAARVEPAQSAIEAREELATVQRLLDAKPEASAWGVGPTLEALRNHRVLTLVVDDLFRQPGVRCANCGSLWEAISGNCPACGGNKIEAVEDVVERALEQALEQKAAIELVRSNSARRAMTGVGPMSALLR